MAKRITDEERIIAFFDAAPVAAAEVVFNIVSARFKARRKLANPTQPPLFRKARRTKPKVMAAAAPSEATV